MPQPNEVKKFLHKSLGQRLKEVVKVNYNSDFARIKIFQGYKQ
jgi:hypothetical protein